MAFKQFVLRDTAGSPERARWSYLARSGSQSHRAIWVILLARRAYNKSSYRRNESQGMSRAGTLYHKGAFLELLLNLDVLNGREMVLNARR